MAKAKLTKWLLIGFVSVWVAVTAFYIIVIAFVILFGGPNTAIKRIMNAPADHYSQGKGETQ